MASASCAPPARTATPEPVVSAQAPPAVSVASATSAVPATSSNRAAWRYRVSLLPGRELHVEASFDPTRDEIFAVDQESAAFVQRVELAQGAAFVPVVAQGASYRIACQKGCRVRYRFQLGAAADALHDIDAAIGSGNAVIAPPSTWLLSPLSAPLGAQLEFEVDPGPAAFFASGFQRSANGNPNSYVAPANALDDSSFAAFGALHVAEVPAGDTTVRLAVAPENLGLTPEQVEHWLAMSAGAVAHYYQGHLPARHGLVVIMKGSGSSTRGETLGGGGPAVLVRASDLVNPTTTRDDWVVTHELLHVNFPDLGRAHAWLSEGLATYLEPVARARVGLIDDQKFWRDLVEGLPQGLPQAGDQGLEHTHTWGRTYWGGALFCVFVDVALRERTGNAHSLDDVIRAIGKTGDVDDVHWEIQQFLDAGRKATGTEVLSDFYAELAEKPGNVDLSAFFERLGVRMKQGVLSFDDSAPLAQIRRSITAR